MKPYRQHKQSSLLIGILFFVFGLFFAPIVTAQNVPALTDITILSIPANPSPGQTVLLTAQSFSTDLTQMTLTWTYGGKTVSAGLGKTKQSVIAPAAGQTAIATVTVSGGIGFNPMTASLLLNPASIDMLWEASDSYAHPFYKGKAFLPIGGSLRVTAIPNASAPKQVTYAWSRNGSALQAASGLNQSSVLLQNTIFNKQETVSTTAYGGAFQGEGTVTIPVTLPTVVAYQKKGGFIDYAHGASQTINIDGAGATLRLEPYFFSSIGNVFDATTFEFLLDGQPVSGDSFSNELRISRPDQEGTHTLNVAVSTIAYSLQHVTKLFNLMFR